MRFWSYAFNGNRKPRQSLYWVYDVCIWTNHWKLPATIIRINNIESINISFIRVDVCSVACMSVKKLTRDAKCDLSNPNYFALIYFHLDRRSKAGKKNLLFPHITSWIELLRSCSVYSLSSIKIHWLALIASETSFHKIIVVYTASSNPLLTESIILSTHTHTIHILVNGNPLSVRYDMCCCVECECFDLICHITLFCFVLLLSSSRDEEKMDLYEISHKRIA